VEMRRKRARPPRWKCGGAQDRPGWKYGDTGDNGVVPALYVTGIKLILK
jgi:hypothetical protein